MGNCATWCNIPVPSSCRSLVAFNLYLFKYLYFFELLFKLLLSFSFLISALKFSFSEGLEDRKSMLRILNLTFEVILKLLTKIWIPVW